MKYYILIIALWGAFFLAYKTDKKQKPETENSVFEIRGKANSYTGQLLLLQKHIKDSSFVQQAVFTNENGLYYLKSTRRYPVDIYYLKMKNHPESVPFLVDNTSLNLYLDNSDFSKSYLTGNSALQREYASYLKQLQLTKNTFSFQKKFIEEHANSVLGAIVLRDILGKTAWRLNETAKLFSALDTSQQKSKIGKYIQQYIRAGLAGINTAKKDETVTEIKKTDSKPKKIRRPSEKKSRGKNIQNEESRKEYAPYFYANNLSGTEISAKRVFNANKLILIDFWASWCVPCRAQTPDLLRLYKQYHAKGFEILSISEDQDLTRWRDAVNNDQMLWQHVIDNYKRLANMYGVRSIPHALLVNSQGEILSRKISPYQLEKILKERLH